MTEMDALKYIIIDPFTSSNSQECVSHKCIKLTLDVFEGLTLRDSALPLKKS